MQKREIFLTVLSLMMTVVLQGCLVAAVGAGAGTVAYMRGDLEAVEAKDIDAVYAATKKAAEQLELKVSSDTKDALSAEIVARDAQDKKITIKLKSTTEDTTQISIRVGTFGSETTSRLIHDQIKKNL
jgi:endo-beta-N-acetylglucosaminidase D